jgi:hypothetical protein
MNWNNINITAIGIYTTITSGVVGIYFFLFKQFLSTSINEKVKIEFSKHLREFDISLQRSSTLSLKHKDLERDALLKFHSICSEQLMRLSSNPRGGLDNQLNSYNDLFSEMDEFKMKSISANGDIYMLVTDDKVVKSSRILLDYMLDLTFKMESVWIPHSDALATYFSFYNDHSDKINEQIIEVEQLEKKIKELQNQSANKTFSIVQQYRDAVRVHLLA